MAKFITEDLNNFTTEGKEIDARGKNTIRINGLTAEQAKKADYKVAGKNLEITVDGKKLVVKNYGGIRYIGTEKVETKGYDLYDIISNSKVENTNVIKYNNAKKRLTEGSTKYNDTIDLSDYIAVGSNLKRNRGLTVNGGDGKDVITGTAYNDTIYGGNGDDTITGGKGNDTIVGGTGTNVINYTKGDGDDTVFLTKGENFTLNLNDLELSDLKFEYANRNRDLKISYSKDNETGSITLKNFARSNVTNNATRRNGYKDTSSVEFNIGGETYDLRSNQKDGNYWFEVKPVGNFSGGWQNDHINATETAEQLNRRRQHVDLVLNGGAGDDLIESSMFADRISGGAGKNTIKYTSLEQLSGDKIYLTRGENVTIDVSGIAGASAKYTVNGRNLDVTVTKGEESKTFTLINFGTKDVTNNKTRRSDNTSSVELKLTDTKIEDLREVVVNSDNGTWHNDIIDKNGYQIIKNKQLVTNHAARGLTINGGDGDDVITGTMYSDKITGGAGTNTIKFLNAFGNDTVYLTKGENATLDFSGYKSLTKSDLKFEYSNRDLKITVADNGTVTLKNYVNSDVVGVNGSVKIKLSNDEFDINNLPFTAKDFKGTTFNGSRLNETIDARDLKTGARINAKGGHNVIYSTIYDNDTITAGNDGNEIYLYNGGKTVKTGSGDDIVHITDSGERNLSVGAGHNQIFVDNSKSFGTVNIKEEKVKATNDIIFTEDLDDKYSITKTGNNLSISKEDINLVTINDYFADRTRANKYATTNFYVNGDITNALDIDALTKKVNKFLEVTGSGTLKAIDGRSNNIITDDARKSNGVSNDNIYSGTGNDIINAGRGKNNIYFYEGSGQDEILSGGGDDTINLLVDKNDNFTRTKEETSNGNTKTYTYGRNHEKSVVIALDEDDTLTVSYGNNDKITVKNYSDSSVKRIKIDRTTYELNFEKVKDSENSSITPVKKPEAVPNVYVSHTDVPTGKEATQPTGYYIKGTNGNDEIIGTSGDDYIMGLGGNDVIYGGRGNDIIMGGTGDDKIYGGKGNDILKGGGGKNIFYFDKGDDSDIIDEPQSDNTLYFYNINSVKDLTFKTVDEGDHTSLIISGYGTGYDKVTIPQFLSKALRYDYTDYKLQADGQKDSTSLYEAVMNSSDISAEIKQVIAGFLSNGNNSGIDTQAITASDTITPEAILTTGTTTPQM